MSQTVPFPEPGRDFFSNGWPDKDFIVRCGITRIGDLTGLDRVGIPVWFACRPNSRGLSVAQGKGLTPAQARISAVMEAVESTIAEQTVPLIAATGSIMEMRSRGLALVPLDKMRRCRKDILDPERSRCWVKGYSFFKGSEVYAPYELIGLDMRAASPWDHKAFRMTTIGLAAGTSRQRAILHALLELVENDATTLVDVLGISGSGAIEVDCSQTANEGLHRSMEMVRAAGMEMRFFNVTGAIPIPTIGCFLQAVFHGADRSAVGLAAGFACRQSASDAALSALLEAVQSRLTKIAGSREDIDESTYATGYSSLPKTSAVPVDIRALDKNYSMEKDPVQMLKTAFETIRSNSGAEDAFIFPLTSEGCGFEVVRVLVPNFEAAAEDGIVQLGSHSIRRIIEMGKLR